MQISIGRLMLLCAALLFCMPLAVPPAEATRHSPPIASASPAHAISGSRTPAISNVGSIEGSVTAVAISGTLAYIAAGGSLVVLDIGNPAQPLRLARLALGGGQIVDLQLVGERAFLSTVDGSLRIVDIHDPSQPALVSTHALDSFRVQVIGNLAYTIAAYTSAQAGSIQVFDVGDPLNLRLRGSYAPTSGFYALDMQVVGGLAYVASDSGFQIVDLRDLNHPRLLGRFSDSGSTVGAVSNSRAYLIRQADDGSNYLDIIDVSQPSKLRRLGSLRMKSLRDLHVAGNLVYAVGDDGLHIVDVSQPVAPRETGAYPIDIYDYASAHRSAIQSAGSLAYIAAGENGLQIIDVANPALPTLRGRYATLGSTTDVQVVGNLAYISAGSRVRIFDVSDPAHPIERGSYFLHSEYAPGIPLPVNIGGIQVLGSLAYVFFDYVPTSCCQAGVLGIMDISDPANPTLIGRTGGWGASNDMQVVGQRAYLTGKRWLNPAPALVIFDVSNPTAPSGLGSYGGWLDTSDNGGAAAVDVAGSLAYVAEYSAGLKIIDVSNPVSPTLRSWLDTPGSANDVQVAGSLAYIADGERGLQIADISNPSSPTLYSSLPLPGNAVSVRVAGNLAYVGSGESGVQVVDISDPARPIPRAHYDTPGFARRIDVAGDLLYVADGSEGLQILKLAPLPSVSAAIPPGGGTLVSPADATSYSFATGTFTSTAIVTHTIHFGDSMPSTGSLAGGHAFDVQARDSATGQPLQPTKPYSITVQYSAADRGPAIESTLALYSWDGNAWVKEPSSTLDIATHTVRATPSHFAVWAVLGETQKSFVALAKH